MPVTGTPFVSGVAVLVPVIVTEICACPLRPPESVARAVIVCVPTVSTLETEPPVPSEPSMLDVHTIAPESGPSCASLAEPVIVTEVPDGYDEPFAGALIETVGAVFPVPPPSVPFASSATYAAASLENLSACTASLPL